MMEYKRLTFRHKSVVDGTEQIGYTERIAGCYRASDMILDRLAELEDKIEQGTLVDTEAYFIVEENQWAGKNRFLVCQNAIQLAVCDFCETREEAEKRLKELKNEKNV